MKKLQEIRVALDERAHDIRKLGKTRELSLALTTVEQARMLLGKVMGELGSATPYPQADNPASAVVEPAADTAMAYEPKLPGDPIADVKQVRAALQVSIDALSKLRRQLWARDYGSMSEVLFEAASTQLTLTKCWLGMQLSRLGDELARKAPAPAAAAAQN